MANDNKRRDQILNGNLTKTIIAICAPIFLYNLFNSFYSLIDQVIVSKIDATSVSAVATLNQIKNLLSSLGAGLAAGGGIVVARLFGAGDFDQARKNSNSIFALSLVIVGVMLIVCIPLSVPIMKLTGVPSELIAIGTGYFIVCIIDLGFVFFNTVFIALQKAKGSTKIIFYLNIMVMFIKLGFTVLFIYGFRVDNIVWAAIATLIGQMILFIILFSIMINKNNIFRLNTKEIRIKMEYIKPIIVLSIPIFLGKFIFSFGKVSVNAMCKSYGPLVVGALGVSNSLCGIVTSPVNSFEEGCSTIVSQNLGNRNMKRAFEAFKKSFIMACLIGTIGYVLVRFIFQDQLINLFAQNKKADDVEEFLRLIKEINRFDSLSIIALAVNAGVLGVLYGFGQTKIAMVVNISRAFVFRIPVLWYLQTFHKEMGAEAAGISMGISNIGIAIMSILFLLYFIHKIKKNGYNGMTFNQEKDFVEEA